MPGHSVIGRLATLDSSSVMWPLKPGSMKPAVECVSSPRRPRGRFALQTSGEVVGQGDELERRAEHELAGVQHERLTVLRFDQRGELVLLLGRVDVGVASVVENPEHAVKADVDAGRLHQRVIERLDAQPPGGDFGPEVAIGEQHQASLTAAQRVQRR